MSASRAFLRAGSKLSALIAFFAVAAIAGTLIACVITPGIAVAGTAAKDQIALFQDLPSNLEITPLAQKTRIYAKDGDKNVLLASFFNQNRDVIKWDDVPKTVKDAAIAGEDIRFYQHGAVDPNGLARAVVSNLRGNDLQGASTITQQYVKNVCIQQGETLPTADEVNAAYEECTAPSINRKIREMRLAIGVEKKYSKNEVLLGYLNIAGFGGRTYGIQAAARYYFDKAAKDLSVGEAATLMSIVNNPESFRLDREENLEGAVGRRDYILGVERDHGMITQAEYEKFSSEKIETKLTPPSTGCQTAGSAAFFCTYVVNTILTSPQFGENEAERRANLNNMGWKIYTTLDLNLQKKAQKAVNQYVPQKPGGADVGAATTSVQVGTGRVLTMVQNKTFKANGAKPRTKFSAVNYNVNELLGAGGGFQPGSTYKAFNMIGWLKSGHSMNQQVNGNARTIPLSNYTACGEVYGTGPYEFRNDANEKGNYTIQAGTAQSINGVFQSMAQEQDLCDMRDIAESLGARNALLQRYEKGKKKGQVVRDEDGNPKIAPLAATPAAAIGTGSSIAPIDMATAYATIANRGVHCTTIGIDEVVDSDGEKVPVPGADCKRVQDEQLMIAAGYDLRNPVIGGTMRIDQLGDGKYMFGKTGTTDNAKDTWVMGSTTKVATAVWVGNVTGNTSLRTIYGPSSCNTGSSQFAVMRHCIFQAVQRTMNAKYGGESSWPYPAAQYVTGGKAIVHDDARPKAAPKPKSSKDDRGDDDADESDDDQ